MKTKRTIRKLRSPLARDLARLSRDLHSMRKRIDSLTDKVEDQDFENRAMRKEISAIRGKMMPQEAALESAKQVAELFAT